MKKKLLYIEKHRIDTEILEVNRIQSFTNDLYRQLCAFGVTNPGAIQNPMEAVNTKLRESMPSTGIEIPLQNILKILNKEEEYQEVRHLSRRVVGHKYINLLEFTDNSFTVKPTARQILTRDMTPYLTDPDEINFVERIEKMVDEALLLSEVLGINLPNTDMLRTFRAYRVDDKTFVSPGDFISRFKNYSRRTTTNKLIIK